MRKNIFRFSFKEHLSLFLIFCLLISQTIQVSFFDRTEAAAGDYRDLVSIVVDRDTYDELSGEIKRYSEDIQGYLGNTRVSLFIVPKDTPPEAIAAQNEKLYYEGDGKDGITSLVGTILIGNVPIPVVHRDGDSFPSLYPYVDFDEKRFVYSPTSHIYQYIPDAHEDTDVEIWHGVINPSVGRGWQGESDIEKIGQFLDKTHDFYTKSGKFVPSSTPPRVFYYDGYNESAAIIPKNVFQYSLYIKNIENFAYQRFTKYLLSDIGEALKQYDADNGDGELNSYITSLGYDTGSSIISDDLVAPLPDIQTIQPVASYIKKFYEVLNKKTLSDEQLFVHNAGRYTSGATVRIDQATVQGTLMDEVALGTIKEGNTALEQAIDKQITNSGYARKAIVFDKIAYTLSEGSSADGDINWYSKIYNGYFFGRKSSEITTPDQCTIARGFSGTDTDFGRSVRVEANAGYDIDLSQSHIDLLKSDTEELVKIHKSSAYACFDASSGSPKISSYWGGNSILRAADAGSDAGNILNTEISSQIKGYSLPIFSLQGMKETSRLANPSLADCGVDNYQYTLLEPYTHTSTVVSTLFSRSIVTKWPTEWNNTTKTPRYTCLTQHESLDSIPGIAKSLSDYQSRTCFVGGVYVDGKKVKVLNNYCYLTEEGATYSYIPTLAETALGYSDVTHYEDRYYHTIPSLWKHISPTDEEIAAESINGVTPSTPVDIKRSVEFLTAKGNIARFEYPNFFQSPGTDVATVRAWLKDLSEQQWNAVIAKESATTLSSYEKDVKDIVPASAIPASPIDWNSLISDEALEKVIQAKKWLHPDITQKAKNVIETSLSYSHQYNSDITKNPPSLPETGSGYEIAYLGLNSFVTESVSSVGSTSDREYAIGLAEIQALNMGQDGVAAPESEYQSSAKCGPPEGVMIFQWPSAIMCWIQSLFPPRIGGGSCGGSTIGAENSAGRSSTTPSKSIQSDMAKLRAYYDNAKLVYHIPKTVIGTGESIAISFDFITRDNEHIELPLGSTIQLERIQMNSDGNGVSSDAMDNYLEVSPKMSPYTGQGGMFALLSHDKLLTSTLRATLTIPLSDGTQYSSVSENVNIRVSDELLDIYPMVDGVATGTLDTTQSLPATLYFVPKSATGLILNDSFPYILDVYDSFDDTLIQSGIVISDKNYAIPYDYTKKIGTYKFILRDNSGRYGQTTLTVRSGPLARATFSPVSSALVVGSESLGVLRLTDKLGNLLTPELHSITVTAHGGYIIDSEGNHVEELHLDSIESELILSYGSSTAGKFSVDISIDGMVQNTSDITILPSARIVFERSSEPKVAGAPVTSRIKVLDADGNIVSGFSSIAEITLPEGAGYFQSGSMVEIHAGKSDDFTFIPGRVAGQHNLSLSIPGVGTISDILFSVAPGETMYMTPSLSDTDLSFFLRDRYGNRTSESFTGTITRDSDTPRTIVFSGGMYSEKRVSGYYKVEAPGIAKNHITYSDESGSHSISGISYASIYVPSSENSFSFLSDYNARYTILAGDSFLRQGEDILYDVVPGKSSSLAVSTLLDAPYRRNALFTVVPGGGISLGQAIDTAISSDISLEKNTLVLTVRDEVNHAEISRIGYPMRYPDLSLCTEKDIYSSTCDSYFDQSHIRFVSLSGSEYITQSTSDSLSIGTRNTPLLSYAKNTGFSLAGGVELVPEPSLSKRHLTVSIYYQDEIIGRVLIATDIGASVLVADDITLAGPEDTPIISSRESTYPMIENYVTEFNPDVHGYTITTSSPSEVLDEARIGPNHIDSFGALRELPGIGWRGQNRLLLSYSAGDTVGEASRWFHTYTYVNLGDPVAHVEHGAPGTEKEGIDRTIGKQIVSSAHGAIRSYTRKDMNHDGYEDIIVVYHDGFIELLQNMEGRFRSKKLIASVPDIGNRGIVVGDFQGDGYGDILAVNASGSFILLDNDARRFSRMSISLSDTMSVPLPTGITQFQISDMDADGHDDIVYLSEKGELGILYGTSIGGRFDQKILDETLVVSLSPDSIIAGGSITADNIPQIDRLNTPSTSTGVDDTILKGEVYFQRTVYDTSAKNALSQTDTLVTDTGSMTELLQSTLTDPNTVAEPAKMITYVKNDYAGAYGIDISKTYKNLSGESLVSGSRVQVDIAIKNTSSGVIKNGEYLDSIPQIFSTENTTQYTLSLNGKGEDRTFTSLGDTYDASFALKDIPVGETLHILYEVEVLSASYGKMIVGKLEGGEVGDDIYGDVGFQSSTTCGADMILWRSGGSRDYTRGTRQYSQVTPPDSIASALRDDDGNDIPDTAENMSLSDRQDAYKKISSDANPTASTNKLAHAQLNAGGNVVDIGLSESSASEINTIAKNLADSMSCGFGGGSCMSFPVNWAPLAPGSDPSIFGNPKGDGLKVDEGLPIFSALTCLPITITCGTSPCTLGIPTVWPTSILRADRFSLVGGSNNPKACGTSSFSNGAGGMLGVDAKANFLRVFVTPTLTLGMGAAICMGGSAKKYGGKPGKGLYPLVSGGNCIVMTKPMALCKGDGSDADGNVRGVSGLGNTTDFWNGESCSLQANVQSNSQNDRDLSNSIVDYLKSKDTTKLNAIYTALSRRGPRSITGGPAIRIGRGGGAGASEVTIEIDSAKPFNLGNIIKTRNIRVAGFPDFIMDWVARQTDEIINKLFSLPNLIIIPPTDLGPNASVDGSPSSYGKFFSKTADTVSGRELKSQMAGAFNNTNAASSLSNKARSNTSLSAGYKNWIDNKIQENSSTINSVQGSANALKAAYKYIGQIPFLRIRQSAVNVNVPWPLPQELDKYARTLDQWKTEINNAKKNWCNGNPDAKCLDSKTNVNFSSFLSSVEKNLRMIDEYKNFPTKLQQYITWRQRYTAWAMCNIESIQQFTGKWVKENGVRFQKWAEFYVLMKAIAQSWQPVIDVFRQGNAKCSVCQNQRYTLDYFKFKAISAFIPSIPIIIFPKWPDIVLDLSDVRLAISIDVPDYKFNISPLRLPNLPNLSLPNSPTFSLSLPVLPTLPRIPELPSFPELPSLPRVSLPPLPPPPRLPKMFGAVSIVTNLVKLYQMIKCYYQNSTLVPEWQVGDVIAQRTARQGTLPIDFLNLQFPQFAIPSVREIRVQTHVNLELQSDFITEYARSSVKPLNSFNSDLGNSLPAKIAPDIGAGMPGNVNIKVPLQSYQEIKTLTGLVAKLENDSQILMDVDEFIPYFRSELLISGQSTASLDALIQGARIDAQKTTAEIQKNHITQKKLLDAYIRAEDAKTKDMENLLDALKKPDMLLSMSDLPIASFVSEENDSVGVRLDEYNQYISSSLAVAPGTENILEHEKISFENRTRRMLAASDTSVVVPETGGYTPDGYNLKFEGIYILTPSGVQTRLFDYIEPLLGSETVDITDIDKDGDKDYIYLMDGVLYVKESHVHEPIRQSDTTLSINEIDGDLLPSAPNNFNEVSPSPGQIELSFSPASERQQDFRLEFFNYYNEWDIVRMNEHDENHIPRTVVDMLIEDNANDVDIDGIHREEVRRSLRAVGNTENFSIEGPLVTSISQGTHFSLTPGRSLYTGKTQARLIYDTDSGSVQDLTLKPYSRYTFDETLSGTLRSGMAYVFDTFTTEKTSYSKDIIGMPILEDMVISNLGGYFDVYDTVRDDTIRIQSGGKYRTIGLSQNDSYLVSIPYENGFYSARLHSLDSDVHAGISLLAPQASLDHDSPIISLDKTIRIPVYQELNYTLSDIVADRSPFSVTVDPDITQDENMDGEYDNDFGTGGAGVRITGTNIVFGPYNEPGIHTVNLSVRDEYGNAVIQTVGLDVYAPVPQIQSVSNTGMLFGRIEEEQDNEPVDLFRIRGGAPIDIISPTSILSENKGFFASGTFFTGSGVELTYSGGSILLDELTGLPLSDSHLSIHTLPADALSPMRMEYRDEKNSKLFEQFIVLPVSTSIVINPSVLAETVAPRIVILTDTSYLGDLATINDPNIPGGAYITDSTYFPIAAIARDGNIYLLRSGYSLHSRKAEDSLVIDIFNGENRAAQVIYKTKFFYTAK